MRRKTKARKRARAQTAAARAAHSAHNHPAIRAHDALVLPTIVRLRGDGLNGARIAQELDGLFEPPGRRGGYQLGSWPASVVLRIARRYRAAQRGAEITVDEGRTGVPRPTRS